MSKKPVVLMVLDGYGLNDRTEGNAIAMANTPVMDKLMKEIKQFNEERDWDQFHSPENLAKSISIEAGELLECFQWNNNYNKEEVCEELADVFTYCIQMAMKLNVDPEEIILNKLEKTKKKYPVDKSKGVSTKYNKL